MPGPLNDAGYCVPAAVDTTAISSPANTTHITPQPPIFLLHKDMKQAESVPMKFLIRDTCSSPGQYRKFGHLLEHSEVPDLLLELAYHCACSWTEAPIINSFLPQNSVAVGF